MARSQPRNLLINLRFSSFLFFFLGRGGGGGAEGGEGGQKGARGGRRGRGGAEGGEGGAEGGEGDVGQKEHLLVGTCICSALRLMSRQKSA